VEEKGYIEIKIRNKDNSLKPEDFDISEIKEVLSDVETFLFPSRKDKLNRPKISYDIEDGSIKNKFFLPISYVLFFSSLSKEVASRKSLDFLDSKRANVIYKFQKKADKENLIYTFSDSISGDDEYLKIDNSTSFIVAKAEYMESEFYVYGEIYQEGGKNPNLHIVTKEYGNLTVSATKEQLLLGDKKLYQVYGLKVSGKQNLEDGSLSELKLEEFLNYKPTFNRSLLGKVIERATENLSKIEDVDSWLNTLRGQSYG